MFAEVISIGDELTSGQRLDTNSQWLSQRLGELGIEVRYHTTVADDLDSNERVFRQAVDRVDVVISTGGLGPTADDLTREALVRVTGGELTLDQASLDHIAALFGRRGREMPPRNIVQAMFPQGSRPIFNPHGTAPGVDLTAPSSAGGFCRVFALPGVPDEMREMWHGTLVNELTALAGKRLIRHRVIRSFGIGESDLEAMLPDLIRRGRTPSVGITVSAATISLRITAGGESVAACDDLMAPTVATIHQCLGNLVYGEGEDDLEHAVCRLLAAGRKTLATVEWGPGGLVAQRLTGIDCPNYIGGLVVQTAQAATGLLGVPPELFARYQPDTAEVAAAMAEHCRERLPADFVLAVSGFPDVSEPPAQPGSVYYALCSASGTKVHSSPYAGHPSILRPRAAKQALNLVRLALLND